MSENNNNNNNKWPDEKTSKQSTDVIFETIGNFGKWQLQISILMALLKLPMAWFQLGNILLAPQTEFYCNKPSQLVNISESEWRNLYTNKSNKMNSCYFPNRSQLAKLNNSLELTISDGPCNFGYFYDRSQFSSSLITEWDLVCEKESLLQLSLLHLMVGVLIGNILFGVAADRYGRKPTLMLAITAQSIFAVLTSIAPTYWSFTLFRCLLGVANGGTMIISFVICVESVGEKYRTIVPILYQIPFGLGSTILAVLGYWIRDWRNLQLSLAALSVLFLLNFWLCSESPRWLFVTNRKTEMYQLLEKICQINKQPIDNIKPALRELVNKNSTSDMRSTEAKTSNFSAIFKHRKLLKRTLILYVNWLMNGMSFFAFTFHLGSIGSNPWITVGVSGIAVIPGALLCVLFIQRVGRKIALIVSNLVIMVCLIGLQFVSTGSNWINLLIISIAVISLATSTPVLYLFTGELFPTVVRNAGVGSAVMFSRIGALLSPFILSWGTATTGGVSTEYWINGPPILIILAAVVGFQALLIIPLPETKDKPLADTIEQTLSKQKKTLTENI